ncbi:MAG TPA: site-2 protease family protein [Blastocatellia bacterium]|nr:site-2 protease family protein [Blastocatellia bacterium]
MRNGIRIGRISGISIYLDWSWIFIFLLVTFGLAGGVLPVWHPDWNPWLTWAVAVAASLLLFASVLLHELAHALVAKSRGLPVSKITLFLFGGASNIEREPDSPKTEFLMALVGPCVSIVLGFIFLWGGLMMAGEPGKAMASPVETFSRLTPLTTLLLWLGPVNIFIGFFNLIPAYPLDGGRILRAGIWAVTKNFRKATRWAARMGMIIGWLFIIAGLGMAFGSSVMLFAPGVINGVWLAFIGWVLNDAASQSYRQTVIQDLLEDVPVTLLMRNDAPVAPPDLPVSALVYDYIMKTGESAFTVVEGDRIVGMVSLEDVRKVPRDAWDTTSVGQIMTRAEQLTAVTPQENASEALDRLERSNVRQAPVVQNGRLVGLLRRSDIMKWLQTQSKFVTS